MGCKLRKVFKKIKNGESVSDLILISRDEDL